MLRTGLACVVIVLVSVAGVAEPVPMYQTVSVEDGYLMWQFGTFCLDVRTTAEVAEGFIPGMINIDVNELQARIGELSSIQHLDILVYCKAGSRGATASQILADNGFNSVFNMQGGFDAWKANCYETAIPFSGYEAIGLDAALDAYEGGVVFIDTRSRKAFDNGHIPNAFHIPLEDLTDNLNELASYTDADIVVYHSNCTKSCDAAAILADNGFTGVFEFPMGYEGWLAAGYDTIAVEGALPMACGASRASSSHKGDLLLIGMLVALLLLPRKFHHGVHHA